MNTYHIKNLLKKLILREKYNSKSYVSYLRKKGISVDETCYFPAPKTNIVDLTRPYLISIGKNVTITSGVTILTHGFDWSVLKIKYGDVLGSAGKVTIEDNCFIGVNSILLKGITIGANSIIGAGSVVCHDIPKNSVAAGNPCRVISSLSAYYEKRKHAQIDEAVQLICSYYKNYKKFPPMNELSEFFWLFQDRESDLPEAFLRKMQYGKSSPLSPDFLSKKRFSETSPQFSSLAQLCEYSLQIEKE